MAQQTINVGASPNDGTGTPLRTAFQYTNSNFSELYTAVGPSGNNIVVPGSATITGDLTVDTNTLKVDSANNRVGIGTASPGRSLDVIGTEYISSQLLVGTTSVPSGSAVKIAANGSAGSDSYLQCSNGSGGGMSIGSSGGAGLNLYTFTGVVGSETNTTKRLTVDSNGVFTFENVGGVAGTAMTLNSTGLGVGGSPTEKLSVNGSLGLQNGGTQRWHISATSGSDLVFTRSTVADRLTITSDGNVGIGVTPSAWGGAGVKVLDVGAAGSFAGSAADVGVVGNAYYNGSGWIYKTSFFSGRYAYALGTGQHQWYTAPSGTAGNAITFTQAMTLDASGRLILLASTTTPATLATNGQLTFTATSNTNLRFSYRGSDGVTRTADLTLA